MTPSSGSLALRLVVFLAPPSALLVAGSDRQPSGWVVGLAFALSLGFAVLPESGFGSTCLALVVCWWAVAATDGVPAAAMAAAMLLLVAHVAALVLSYGPPGMALVRPVCWLWLRRSLIGLLRDDDRGCVSLQLIRLLYMRNGLAGLENVGVHWLFVGVYWLLHVPLDVG